MEYPKLEPWTKETHVVKSDSIWASLVCISPFMEHPEHGVLWQRHDSLEDPSGRAYYYITYTIYKSYLNDHPHMETFGILTDGDGYLRVSEIDTLEYSTFCEYGVCNDILDRNQAREAIRSIC